jgi:Cellulase (glycosyl hydrolase family 5)
MRSRSSLPADGPLSAALGPGCWLITPHFYDPRAGAPDLTPEPSRYPGTVAAASAVFDAWDVVPVVGEFGCDAVKRERDACHKAWIDLFEQRGWSWCLWNFNPDAASDGDDHWCDEKYSVARADEDGSVQPTGAYFALLRPFPRRYGGPLLAATWDGKTWNARVGQAYRPGWRTEIYVPRSLGAFRASAGVTDDRVVILDTDSGPAELTIALLDS